jgi:hypothetical protein
MPNWYVLVHDVDGSLAKEGPVDDDGLIFGGTLDPVTGRLSRQVMDTVYDEGSKTPRLVPRLELDAEPGYSIIQLDLTHAQRDSMHWDAVARGYVDGPEVPPVVPQVPEIDPHAPITKLSFLRRIGMTKLTAMMAAQATDPVVAVFRLLLDASSEVRMDDPDTVAGIGYMAAKGILDQSDVGRILAPPTAEEM